MDGFAKDRLPFSKQIAAQENETSDQARCWPQECAVVTHYRLRSVAEARRPKKTTVLKYWQASQGHI